MRTAQELTIRQLRLLHETITYTNNEEVTSNIKHN